MRSVIARLNANMCVVFASGMLVGMPSSGFCQSGNSDDVALEARTAYTKAQRQWQQDLADFLSNRRPDLKKLIFVSRDLQLAMIERRSLEFSYLLKTHPERIVRDSGISQFSNFDWTDQDGDALRRSNPDYALLEKRVQVLRQRNDGDPQWPALRAAYQSLAKEAEYQQVYGRFQQRVKEAEKLLAGNR
jgi:hypothetical protein